MSHFTYKISENVKFCKNNLEKTYFMQLLLIYVNSM